LITWPSFCISVWLAASFLLLHCALFFVQQFLFVLALLLLCHCWMWVVLSRLGVVVTVAWLMCLICSENASQKKKDQRRRVGELKMNVWEHGGERIEMADLNYFLAVVVNIELPHFFWHGEEVIECNFFK